MWPLRATVEWSGDSVPPKNSSYCGLTWARAIVAYKVLETCILFPWGLSRGECASWVQAWGSILAIIFAVFIAIYQARRQQKNTINAIVEQRRQDHLWTAETLSELTKNSLKLQKHIAGKLNSREAVHDAAEDGLPFDMPGLRALEHSLDSIDLHSLPASLVALSMILSSTVRQFRSKVEMALQFNREMDGAAFNDFFETLNAMNASLEKTADDFDAELQRLRSTLGLVSMASAPLDPSRQCAKPSVKPINGVSEPSS